MNIEDKVSMLEEKDTSEAFAVLKELEKISEDSNILYPYMDKFIEMAGSPKYVIRVRGFRLFCKQARWDIEYKIDENITTALKILNDEKPTAVRQALAALKDVVIYKKEMAEYVKEKVLAIDYLKYRDTMHNLIAKDIRELLSAMK